MTFTQGLIKIAKKKTDYSKLTPRQREIIKYKSVAKRNAAIKKSLLEQVDEANPPVKSVYEMQYD